MDRFDDLLIKARAEMLGKSQPRQVITKDTAFSMAWDLTKGFEDQMRAMQARQQRPGFMQRIKNKVGERKTPQQSVSNNLQQMGGQRLTDSVPLPTRQQQNEQAFNDPFGQATGNVNVPATSSRISGQSPTMADLGPGGFGQGGGAERPLEPSQVPRREEINTEQPVTESTEQVSGSPPSSAWWSQGGQYKFPGENPAVRSALNRQKGQAPSRQDLLEAFQTLGQRDQREDMLRVNAPEKRTVGATTEEATRPLDITDIPMVSEQKELDPRTQGDLGDRTDPIRNQNYKDIEAKRKKIEQRRINAINSGKMTSGEAIRELKRIRQAGKYPELPTLEETPTPTLNEANRRLGGETLSPNQKREAVAPTRQKTTTQEYKRPINPNHLPVPTPKPSNTALSTRGEEKIEPLDEIPMQDGSVKRLGSGPIRNPLQLGQGRSPLKLTEGDGTQRTSQAKAGQKLERQNPNIIDNFKRPKRKRTPKKKEPEPQTNLPEPGETRGALDENETAMGRAMLEAIRDSGFGQPQEQTESVKQTEPKVEEQATKLPTTDQTTLFGGGEESAPVEDKKATETEATKRSKRRKTTRESTEATTKVGGEKGGAKEKSTPMKAIRNMSSEEVGELILDAQEGKKEAMSHIKNNMDEVERVHPQFMDEMEELFGETFKMSHDTNLSLLPSGMRNSLLKENNADVNYSLLPNGWV